ncbi:hypothetical protein FKM82_007256 [Ascaphus truei]
MGLLCLINLCQSFSFSVQEKAHMEIIQGGLKLYVTYYLSKEPENSEAQFSSVDKVNITSHQLIVSVILNLCSSAMHHKASSGWHFW